TLRAARVGGGAGCWRARGWFLSGASWTRTDAASCRGDARHDDRSRASLQVAEIGELMVDPGSRLRLLETGSRRKRIAVEVGTIHAAIWAPPGEFVVDTPSAIAVDLGCAYSLTVAEDGSGTLRTKLGWVGFHESGHDSFIPAGAMCLTRP